MARRKNVKRIDPRYFLEETTHRDDEGRIDEIFSFGKDAKNRKAGEKILAGWIEKGTADDMYLPDARGLETEILPWMGKGIIDDDYPEGYSDDLGTAAMYIAKLSRDQEALPDEEKAFQDVFKRDIEGRQADRDSMAASRADLDARMASRRDPKKFSAQLERAKKQLMGPERSPDRLARALKIQDIERASKDPQYAVDNLSELIPILKQAENYLNNYEAALRAIETTKGEMERYGVELPEVISNLERVQQRIDKTVASSLRAYFKKAYKNVEQADKERHGRAVSDREQAGRVGAGSRLAPAMSDADSQRGYGGLRGRMSESQLKEIIKEELGNVLNEVKLDGYDYGFRGDERLEFNNAIRKNPDAARKVARMSVEEVSDWWEEYKKMSRGYEAPPGDPGPMGHPYDYPPGEEGRYSYGKYGYEE